MGEILGVTDEEQLEVYRAVVDLVRSRIAKANSFENDTKTKEGMYTYAAKKVVVERFIKEP